MPQWDTFLGLWAFFILCLLGASAVAGRPVVRHWRLKRKRRRQRMRRDYRQSLDDDDTFWG